MRCALLFGLCSTVCLADSEVRSGHTIGTHDETQITLECRFVSVSASVLSGISKDAFTLPAPHRPEIVLPDISDAELASNGGIQLVAATSVVRQQTPLIVRAISEAAIGELIRKAQADEQSNILFAPKVTLFNNQSATIQDMISRPFATAAKIGDGQKLEDRIQEIDDGTRLHIRPVLKQNDSIRLDLQLVMSDIKDVYTAPVSSRNKVIQVPVVKSNEVQMSAVLQHQETLLIAEVPVGQSAKTVAPGFGTKAYVSQLLGTAKPLAPASVRMILITPRIIAEATESPKTVDD